MKIPGHVMSVGAVLTVAAPAVHSPDCTVTAWSIASMSAFAVVEAQTAR